MSNSLIARHDMGQSKIRDLPAEKQQDRTLEMLDNLTCTPEKEVTIS